MYEEIVKQLQIVFSKLSVEQTITVAEKKKADQTFIAIKLSKVENAEQKAKDIKGVLEKFFVCPTTTVTTLAHPTDTQAYFISIDNKQEKLEITEEQLRILALRLKSVLIMDLDFVVRKACEMLAPFAGEVKRKEESSSSEIKQLKLELTKGCKVIAKYRSNVTDVDVFHKGLWRQTLTSNSDCFYEAVAYYLTRSTAVEQLRERIAEGFKQNPQQYEGFAPLNEAQPLQEYVTRIGATHYADVRLNKAKVNILMRLLNCPIVVIGSEGTIMNHEDLIPYHESEEPIFVFSNGLGQYDALILCAGYTGKAILTELLQKHTSCQAIVPALPADKLGSSSSEAEVNAAPSSTGLEINIIYPNWDLNLAILKVINHALAEYNIRGITLEQTATEQMVTICPFIEKPSASDENASFALKTSENFADLANSSSEKWKEFMATVEAKYQQLSQGVCAFTSAALVNKHLLEMMADNPDEVKIDFTKSGELEVHISPKSKAIEPEQPKAIAPTSALSSHATMFAQNTAHDIPASGQKGKTAQDMPATKPPVAASSQKGKTDKCVVQ